MKQSNQKAEMVRLYKKEIQLYAVYKRHSEFKDTNKLKVKGWKKIYHANSN